MEADQKKWVEDAIELCERATSKKILLLWRNDDLNIILTNVGDSSGMVKILAEGLCCGYGVDTEDTKDDEE